MEALGGSLALANSSEPVEHDEADSPVVDGAKDYGVSGVAGCSSEMCVVMVQSRDDPPDLNFIFPEKVPQDVEEQGKGTTGGPKSLEVSEVDALLGGSGVLIHMSSSSLLGGYLSNFNCTMLLSLLDTPILVQIEEDSTCARRRSGRSDVKNKHCNIPLPSTLNTGWHSKERL
jgi:hypothetical protein